MKRPVVIVLAVVGVLALMCVGGMVIGRVWLAGQMGPPEGVTVQVTRPDSVVTGQVFDVVVTVTDTSGRARTIRDIDLWETLPDGVTVVSVSPPYAEADLTMGFLTYTMNRPLAAHGTETITLTMKAGAPGVYSGDLDVGVDDVFRVNTTELVITVTGGE
jgi:hypothetical protein